MGSEILPTEIAFAFAGARLAEGEQTTEPRIGAAVGRVDKHREVVTKVKATPHHKPDADVVCTLMRARNARECVVISDTNRGEPEKLRLCQQLLDV
jgi:hypothetical protein